jgi:shikimate kinase
MVAQVDGDVADHPQFIDRKHEVARRIGDLDHVFFREAGEHRFRITEGNMVSGGRF